MAETVHTFCRICESLCGLEMTREGRTITEVRPDAEHVATRGFACIKGIKQQKIYASPDRLTRPLRRRGQDFEEISWEEAFSDIGAKLRRLRKEEGPESIAMYVGTAAGFSMLHPVFAQGFMQGIGSPNIFSSATQDCANKFAVANQMYGFPFLQPFPDLERTNCLIIVGANPVMSKWSFLQVPNPFRTLKEMEKRGARIFVVDPRRTETADAAGEHLFIRPDTDVFFYLAFLHEVLRRGAVDRQKIERYMEGYTDLAPLVAHWTPARCAEVTGIPADRLKTLVDAYLAADGAVLYSSTGVNMGTDGSLAFWLQEVINAITGNLDRPGGTRVGEGIFDFARFGHRVGMFTEQRPSRVGGYPRTNDAFPGGILADEILTPGKGQVKALIVTGGNPLITMPNSGRLREALRKLEVLVSLDLFMNETASEATHILPCTSPLERPDLPFVFPLFLGMQMRPYLQATGPVLPPPGDVRDEASIYHDLCRATGVGLFGSRAITQALEGWRRWNGTAGLPQEKILDFILRMSGQPRFSALLAAPHGLPRTDLPQPFLGRRVTTPDRKVQLAPTVLLQLAQQRILPKFEREKSLVGRFRLITKRALTTHNSWTHNLEDFVPEQNRSNHLWMNPEDAEKLGLQEGDVADVTSSVTTLRLPVRRLGALMPGVVALPHGWGHQHARGLSVAAKTAGVNVNLLAEDGPGRLEPLSGMAHLTGIVVDVRPAAGERDPANWSGRSDG